MLLGALLFIALGKDPLAGLKVFLIDPFSSKRAISELLLKSVTADLVRARAWRCASAPSIWNIGAEGQLTSVRCVPAPCWSGSMFPGTASAAVPVCC